jgi:hypothetical protein
MARGAGIIRARVAVTPTITHVGDAFVSMIAEAQDWRPAWPRVVQTLIDGVKRVVASRGAELGNLTYGHVWEPADPRYLRRKARSGHGRVDLLYSGRMLRRVTSEEGVISAGPSQLSFGVRGIRYAPFLNFVKRPFLGMSRWMEQAVHDDMQAYMDELVTKRFRSLQGAH